jgi:hypothetical protein
MAGCFSFSIGQLLEDVPPDLQLYFRGEEANMCVRSFTRGYGLFHPHKIICWHEYLRKNKPKHWEDHVAPRTTSRAWHELEQRGLARLRRLIGIDPPDPSEHFGIYGLGSQRSLRDYQRYAGVHFGLQGVEDHTWRRGRPPSPLREVDDAAWLQSLLRTYWVDITVDRDQFTRALGEPTAWSLSLYSSGSILHEHVFSAVEMEELRGRRHSTLHVQYLSREPATDWTIFGPWRDARPVSGACEQANSTRTAARSQ